jgi:four helix bundle protein
MENKEFSNQLEIRTRKFAISIIKLSSSLPKTEEGKVIRNQITKSGTSIGANYREANRSRSKADFANRIRICESEASETSYWLEIIEDLTWIDSKNIRPILTESNELVAIYTTIGKKLKTNLIHGFLLTLGTLGILGTLGTYFLL